MEKTKIMGYVATNTGTGKLLPIAPTLSDAVDYMLDEIAAMLKEKDRDAFKTWEISAAEATIEAPGGTPYAVAAMMATAAGAWKEVKPAFVFLITAADTLTFRPFAADCAK